MWTPCASGSGARVASVPAPLSAPAFCFLTAEGDLRPVTYTALGEGIKRLVSLIGHDPAQYATHSLGRGGATYAVQSGANPLLVQQVGDWASPTSFQLYVVLGAPEKLSCTAGMLTALRRSPQG